MTDNKGTIAECDFTNQVLLSHRYIFFPPQSCPNTFLRMLLGQFLCFLDNLLDGTHHVECLLRQCIILSCSRKKDASVRLN